VSDNNKHSSSLLEGEINFSEIFLTLREYKYSIMFIGLIFMLFAGAVAYITPNTYQAVSSIEILTGKVSKNIDFMSDARGIDINNVENEIAILSSYSVRHRALESLNLGIRYFSSKNLKTEELYKKSPFIVTTEFMVDRLKGERIKLIAADKNSFHLIVKASLMDRALYLVKSFFGPVKEDEVPIAYHAIHRFDTPVYTPWFTLRVQKIHTLLNENYSFSVEDNEDAIDVEKFLAISPSTKNGSVVQLSYDDTVSQRAQEILAAIINAYIDQNLQVKKKSAEKSLDFIDKQLTSIHAILSKSATSLQQYKSTNTIIDISNKALMTAEKLSDLESKVYELDIQVNVIENILNFVQANKSIEGINVDSVQSASPSIISLIQKIQESNALEKSLLVDYTEFHPDVIKTREQSKALKNTLIEALKHSLSNRKQQKQSLAEIIDKEKSSFESLPKQEQELAQLSRSFMANEKIYSFLLEKRAETAILQSSTLSGTRVIDLSVLLKEPIKPKRIIMLIAGLFIGLLVGIVAACIRAKRHDFIRTVADITDSTTIPIFGMIPQFELKKKSQSFYEAMRVVRTNVDFFQSHNTSKLITITSSISGEGKTTLICELAKIIALTEKKVLLVDLDMRKPKVHEKLSLRNNIGMSTLLSGQSNLDDVMKTSKETPNLHIIPAGPIPPNPSELLLGQSFKMMLKALSSKYDYILFDSPPIGHVTDASVLMQVSDISLIVLKLDYSKKDFIKNINRLKTDQKFNNIGLVVNGLEESNFSYGYGSSY
jgi:capsular exopolysaccharide synthesis family protein